MRPSDHLRTCSPVRRLLSDGLWLFIFFLTAGFWLGIFYQLAIRECAPGTGPGGEPVPVNDTDDWWCEAFECDEHGELLPPPNRR